MRYSRKVIHLCGCQLDTAMDVVTYSCVLAENIKARSSKHVEKGSRK